MRQESLVKRRIGTVRERLDSGASAVPALARTREGAHSEGA
ncbi:MAG: hypothetical protein AVDCRST_MAG13-2494 [uncultured Solirubrobacteraceae bacterium]|uniref:Uncharacterized protein n=1 Tax=uncultured Solirubrobacteraceae bacterium TaxID=1162706 RepID=A0A6J4SU17_9ACTN|nr:MAG: hypothetical protein AVDCRST_MAG13-2494 [uncultured Solirubrobacteraceae bacterium]